MAKIDNIVVHCSDSTFGDAHDIRNWHKERGWRDIGYHFVILNGHLDIDFEIPALNGSIEVGRTIDGDNILNHLEVGAHALGYNQSSIGICLIGTVHFTHAQWTSLVKLVRDLQKYFSIPRENVLGHYEIKKSHGKTCPNLDMRDLRVELRADV